MANELLINPFVPTLLSLLSLSLSSLFHSLLSLTLARPLNGDFFLLASIAQPNWHHNRGAFVSSNLKCKSRRMAWRSESGKKWRKNVRHDPNFEIPNSLLINMPSRFLHSLHGNFARCAFRCCSFYHANKWLWHEMTKNSDNDAASDLDSLLLFANLSSLFACPFKSIKMQFGERERADHCPLAVHTAI